MLAIATITTNIIIVRNFPRGTPFDEYNDLMRIVIFDLTRYRTAYSFTLNKYNILTMESGLVSSRTTLGTYLDRLQFVMNGTFMENQREITKIVLNYQEMEDLVYLLNRLEFCRMPRRGEFPSVMSGHGNLWAAIFYFNRIHYGAMLEMGLSYTDSPDLGPLRDVVDKMIELSGANINLRPR